MNYNLGKSVIYSLLNKKSCCLPDPKKFSDFWDHHSGTIALGPLGVKNTPKMLRAECCVYSFSTNSKMYKLHNAFFEVVNYYWHFQSQGRKLLLRTPKMSLISKIPIFWAWADKLGRTFLGHLGSFRPIYQHPFW